MIDRVPRITPGVTPIDASALNRGFGGRRLGTVVGSPALVRVVPCRVVAAVIAEGAEDFGGARLPGDVTYDANPIGGALAWGLTPPVDEGEPADEGEPLFRDLTPSMGRPIRGDEAPIHPAREDDLCEVWLVFDSAGNATPELRVLTEAVAVGCDEGSGGP